MTTFRRTDLSFTSADNDQYNRKMSPLGHPFRLIGLCFGFIGLTATLVVCPFYGQSGFPVGLASAGTAGILLSLCVQDWKRFFKFI
jgi:hypothetical protein